jgi:hypothetical protein
MPKPGEEAPPELDADETDLDDDPGKELREVLDDTSESDE